MSVRPSFPSIEPSSVDPAQGEAPARVRVHLVLFVLTAVSVFHMGASQIAFDENRSFFADLINPTFLLRGASFAIPLLAILLTHEFGHFFAARWHGVPASLPYFIPAPGLGAGTFGAVISMRERIRSRSALLDIGASGPLAGLLVALPALAWGIAHSEIIPIEPNGSGDMVIYQEGQSLLYLLLKRLVIGEIPAGYDVLLHPTAHAGWYGLLLTMLNLLPWGQLDGGHVAYALFGERHHALARWFRHGLLGLFVLNLGVSLFPIVFGQSARHVEFALVSSAFWLIWYLVLGALARVAGGAEHPPCDPSELSPARHAVGWVCLVLFVLLFMPTPMAVY
jgi:membrane-associated protease RseP (regulator of RpoE activity)